MRNLPGRNEAVDKLLLQYMGEKKARAILVSSGYLGIFFPEKRTLLDKIYSVSNRAVRADMGPFLLLVNEKGRIYRYLIAPEIERGNMETLKEEGWLSNTSCLFYGKPYFTLEEKEDNAHNVKSMEEEVIKLVKKHKVKKLVIEEKVLPLCIYSKLKNAVKVCYGGSDLLDNLSLDLRLSPEEISLYGQATSIGRLALHKLKERIGMLGPEEKLPEKEIFNILDKTVSELGGRIFFAVIQSTHTCPRGHSSLLEKCVGSDQPYLRVDFCVKVEEEGYAGICDIGDTFFINSKNVSGDKRKEYNIALKTYETIRGVLSDVAGFIKVGLSGEEIHSYTQKLLDSKYSQQLIDAGLTKRKIKLNRNIGHWIKSYVEGQPMEPGQKRRLKEGDIVCLELPLGSGVTNLSISYETQGVVTQRGFEELGKDTPASAAKQ